MLFILLDDMGHKQAPTTIVTDSSTAHSITTEWDIWTDNGLELVFFLYSSYELMDTGLVQNFLRKMSFEFQM
eukprot:13908480-Ditylum_brightwellii.AAC.1